MNTCAKVKPSHHLAILMPVEFTPHPLPHLRWRYKWTAHKCMYHLQSSTIFPEKVAKCIKKSQRKEEKATLPLSQLWKSGWWLLWSEKSSQPSLRSPWRSTFLETQTCAFGKLMSRVGHFPLEVSLIFILCNNCNAMEGRLIFLGIMLHACDDQGFVA